MNLITFCLLFFLLPNSKQFVEIVVMPSTGNNYNLLLLDLQTDTIRSRDRQTDMDGGKERKIEWSYPQVVFAAERLQQLLIVLVSHLSQKRQQTRHKFSLTTQHIMRGRRWSFNVVAYSGQNFLFLSFWKRNEFKK